MGISVAERNRRKRERKKREKERRRREEDEKQEDTKEGGYAVDVDAEDDDGASGLEVEIEYVSEPLLKGESPSALRNEAEDSNEGALNRDGFGGNDGDDNDETIEAVLRRFEERSAVQTGGVITDEDDDGEEDEDKDEEERSNDFGDDDEDDDEEDRPKISRRKWREMIRPTVAELKNAVERADLVEAHDVTAADPHFLIELKSLPGTVAVPRHWGRKRKYLQGKRGIEKAPFALPEFIRKTGIAEVRSAVQEDHAGKTLAQKNRARVAPKVGAVDIDYRTLYDAFFLYQTKPKMTGFGDLYYEGKEFETHRASDYRPGRLSDKLKRALGLPLEGVPPPPWLMNMQRHGPPPSYPNLRIPGLNAPLPPGCSYGYHVHGYGKPPVDAFGRPLYGGDPFGAPTPVDDGNNDNADGGVLVTSDGATLSREPWGALPTAAIPEEEDDDDEDDDDDDEEEDGEEVDDDVDMETDGDIEGIDGAAKENKPVVMPPPLPGESDSVATSTAGAESVVLPNTSLELRKSSGEETPAPPEPKLYRVLEQTKADTGTAAAQNAIFASDVAYVLPPKLDGAESVLSKAGAAADPTSQTRRRKHDQTIDDDDDPTDTLGKKFKF